MATIKIKELPVKSLDSINSTDLMIIEDSIDTKQITVEDLQLFFSSDKKVTALRESMEQLLTELENEFNEKINSLRRDDNEIENRLNDLYNDHERTKQRLGNLIEKVVDIENLLNTTIERVEKNETSISNLQKFTTEIRSDLDTAMKNIEDHTDEIDKIKDKNEEQDLRFEVDEEYINEFKEEYDKKMKELDETINTDRETAKTYSDQLYDQIIQYIDFYHHLHEDPPNFDDPNQADTQQMNLIYKVGTIYETTIEDFEPEGNLPGTWEYVGMTNVYDNDGSIKLRKYTYVRTI